MINPFSIRVIKLIVVCMLLVNNMQAQISYGGIPASWHRTIPELNAMALLPGTEAIPKQIEPPKDVNAPFVFAEVFYLGKGLQNSGQWDTLSNGDKIWRLAIKSPGAYSINFTFEHFKLPVGANVFIYTPDKKEVLGSFNFFNNTKSGILPVSPLTGDEVIVEYFEPASIEFSGELSIGYLGHDYLGVFGKDGQFGVSGTCNVDINCDLGTDWQVVKHSVCRLIVNNHELCTGTLVNNTRKDQTPYILSANHCVNTQDLAENTLFYFNYESPTCQGPDGSVSQSIAGADLVATKNKNNGYLDFTLLKLRQKVPLSFEPYFAGWDSRGNLPTNTTAIHHPWGDVKKISVDADASIVASYLSYGYDPNSFWKVLRWDSGTTEGGSSGCPLFNADKRIVGTLTGGDADCTESVNDYFQMFSVSYDKYSADTAQLKHWLDPDNSGVEFLDGFKPQVPITEVIDEIVVSNVNEGDSLAFYLAGTNGEDGFVAGNNTYGDKAKADYFSTTLMNGRNVITGFAVMFAKAEGRPTAPVEAFIIEESAGVPGNTILATTSVTMQTCIDNAQIDYVRFDVNPPVTISKSVFVGITLPQFTGDTIALMTSKDSKNHVNTAWELNVDDVWVPYSTPDISWEMNVSHMIYLFVGRYSGIDEAKQPDYNVFPNPAVNQFNISALNSTEYLDEFKVFDALGRLMATYNLQGEKTVSIDCSQWASGLYVIKTSENNGIHSLKVMVQH